MGVILDTNVFVVVERQLKAIDFNRWQEYGGAFISAVTAAELLLGVQYANTPERRLRRAAFAEAILNKIPVLPFDLEVAKIHAQMRASIPKRVTLGAHDLMIAATAISRGFPVLTADLTDFKKIPGLKVLAV